MRIVAIFITVTVSLCIAALSVALRIPGVVVLDSISNIYEPVKFDHATHSKIAEGCVTCHHEHPANAETCRDCHRVDEGVFKKSLSGTFMSCDSCHGKYDPETPNMPGLKVAYHRKCFQCHKGMGMIGKDPKGCTQICHAKKTR